MKDTFTNFGGIRILTEETTLTDKIRALMDVDLLECCMQMRFYFLRSLQDINNADKPHNMSSRKFINLWYEIIRVSYSRIVWYYNERFR